VSGAGCPFGFFFFFCLWGGGGCFFFFLGMCSVRDCTIVLVCGPLFGLFFQNSASVCIGARFVDLLSPQEEELSRRHSAQFVLCGLFSR